MSFEDLGKRAVACKHFYWTQGMLASSGRRVGVWIPGTVCGASEPEPVWPDLDDPGTLGCLLALVREAWTQDPMFQWATYAVPVYDGLQTWRVGCIVDGAKMVAVCDLATMTIVEAKTEAEVLVAALEAAP